MKQCVSRSRRVVPHSVLVALCAFVLAPCVSAASEAALRVEQVGTSSRVVIVGSWTADGVQGWLWNLCHNPDEVSIGNCAGETQPWSPCDPGACSAVTCPEDMQTPGPQGQEADFNVVSVFSNGISQSVVLSLDGAWSLPATDGFAMLAVTYDFAPQVSCSKLEFCTTQAQDPTALVLFTGDRSVIPDTQGLELCPGACTLTMKLSSKETDKLSVLLDTCEGQDVTGFQFGLAVDSQEVRVESIEPGAAVEAAGGADFWGVRVHEGKGATLGAVLALEPAGGSWRALPANTADQEIARVTLCTTAGESTVTVGLTGELGDPVVEVVVDVDGTSYTPELGDPVSVTVQRSCAAQAQFVRGDVNQDGRLNVSDGVAIARFVFNTGRHRDLIAACQDSADANDDGEVTLVDALYVLRYLFTNGPDIPPPAGSCGPDPTEDSLGCSAFRCP